MGLFGLADLHAHYVPHMGFGGLLLGGGEPWPSDGSTGEDALATALPHCWHQFVNPDADHDPAGYPEFTGWPNSRNLAHQRAFVEWIHRAVELGGLRLAVCLAVNNELITSRLATLYGGERFPFDDVSAVDLQLDAMRKMVAYVDATSGGPGHGWMQIAETPAQARAIVASGRLAIVLGIEVDSLGGWRTPNDLEQASGGNRGRARELIGQYLDKVYAAGVRHVFPIHHSNNAFGGAAVFNRPGDAGNFFLTGASHEVEDGSQYGVTYRIDRDRFPPAGMFGLIAEGLAYGRPTGSLPAGNATWSTPGGHINKVGLTAYGHLLVEELMRRGMIIDIDHMSHKSIMAVLDLAEARSYPVVAGHASFRELKLDPSETSVAGRCAHEWNSSPQLLERVRRLGGMIGVMLEQTDLHTYACDRPVNNNAPGSAKSTAQALLYAIDHMGGKNVGIGSDVNTTATFPWPRFGPRFAESIKDDDKRKDQAGPEQRLMQSNGVRYQTPILDYRQYRWQGGFGWIWMAIAIHKSGVAIEDADLPPPSSPVAQDPQPASIIAVVKGFGCSSREEVDHLYPTGSTAPPMRPRALAAFLAAHEQEPDSGDHPDTKRLHSLIAPLWTHWTAMESGLNEALPRSIAGRRDFDINLDGMAHYGLLPDFLQDLRNVGMFQQDLDVLNRSAEDYIQVWERCSRRIPKKAALGRYPDGSQLDVWVTANDGQVYTAFYNDGGVPWNGWHQVAGAVPSGLPPGAPVTVLARYPDGSQLDVWVTANDGQVYTAFYNDGGVPWNGWHQVAGAVPSGLPPGAPVTVLARYPDGSQLDVWVTANDGQVYTAFYNDGGVPWNGWHQVAGAVPSGLPPGAPVTVLARYPDGSQLDVWVTANDGQVYTAFYNDGGVPWNGWHQVAGAVPSGLPPGAPVTVLARYPDGSQLDVWVTANDGQVYTAFYNDGGVPWNGWHQVAGAVPSGLPPGAPVTVLARYPDGSQLDVWVTANDGQVYTAFYNDGGVPWNGWHQVAGAVPSGLPPGAPVTVLARYPDGSQLDVWVTANDGQVYTAFYNDGGVPWNGWHQVASEDQLPSLLYTS